MHPCARSSSFSLFAAVQLALLLSLLSHRSAQAQLLQEKSFRTSNMAQKEKWLLASGVLLVGFAVDRPVQSWRGDSFSPFMRQYVEPFGKEFGLVGSLAFFGYAHLAQDRKACQVSVGLGRALVFSYLGANGLKMIFRRSRPNTIGHPENLWFQYEGQPPNTNSFPSGHATYAASMATVLCGSYPESRWMPYAAWGIAGLVGLERIYNGMHHPSDVIAGFMLGYVLGRLSVKSWKIDAYFLPQGAGLSVALDR